MDYTIQRSNPNRRIIVCPKCGRKGHVSWHDEKDDIKSTLVVHVTEALSGMDKVTDSCWVKRKDVRDKYPKQCEKWDAWHERRRNRK